MKLCLVRMQIENLFNNERIKIHRRKTKLQVRIEILYSEQKIYWFNNYIMANSKKMHLGIAEICPLNP